MNLSCLVQNAPRVNRSNFTGVRKNMYQYLGVRQIWYHSVDTTLRGTTFDIAATADGEEAQGWPPTW
jgi:hypothetical protein